jgi:hypothetical protein
VLVLVGLFEPRLMDVRMVVGVPVVGVLVVVLDVLVIVACVGVGVTTVLVYVLVRVRHVVCVILGHDAPAVVWLVDVGLGHAVSGAPARRCSMWRSVSSSNVATWES